MKKTIKTYGAKGLMEWVCRIPVGKAHLNVEFSGGALTAYGNTPALFKTDNPVKQSIIENSSYFKDGKITIIRSVTTGSDDQLMSPKKGVNKVKSNSNKDSSTKKKNNVIEVDSIADAKDYLVEKFEISSDLLRTKSAILEVGKQNGITFKGI